MSETLSVVEGNHNPYFEKTIKNQIGPEYWVVKCTLDDGEIIELEGFLTMRSAFEEIKILDQRLLPRTIKALSFNQMLENALNKDED